jgi:hypothetical protein
MFEIIYSLACCATFVFIPLLLIYFIIKLFRKSSYKQDKNRLIIEWLIDQKNKGAITVDDLINIAKQSYHINPYHPTTPKNIVYKRGDKVVYDSRTESNYNDSAKPSYERSGDYNELDQEQFEKDTKYSVPSYFSSPQDFHNYNSNKRKELTRLSNAEILLYLGSALVLFSIFVLVAFNWQTFNNLVKSIILIILTFGFYGLGIVLNSSHTLRKAGLTFITIGSLSLGFLGLGLWNFGLKDSLGISFQVFWLIHSVVLLMAYSVTLYLLKLNRFFYFLLISLYSFIISFSFTLTDDPKFRVVVIAALNLIIYSSDGLFNKFSSEVKMISRVLNMILDLIIFLTILGLSGEIDDIGLKYIAAFSLLVPAAFILLSFFKDKARIEPAASMILVPMKFMLILWIFGLQLPAYITLFTLYALIVTLFNEYTVAVRSRFLFILSSGINILIVSLTSIIVFVDWMDTSVFKFNSYLGVLIMLGNSMVLLTPLLVRNNLRLLSIAVLYPILASLRIFTFLFPESGVFYYVLLLMIEHFVFAALFIWFRGRNKQNGKIFVVPSLIFTSILLLGLSLFGESYIILFAYSLIAFSLSIIANVTGKTKLEIITIFLKYIAFWAFITYLQRFELKFIDLDNVNVQGLLMLLPGFGYFILHEIRKRKYKETYFNIGIILFTLTAVSLTISNSKFFLFAVFTNLLYAAYYLVRYKSRWWAISFFIIAQVYLVNLFIVLGWEFEKILLPVSVLNLFFAITSTNIIKILGRNLDNFVFRQFETLVNAASILIFAIVFILLSYTANYFLFATVIVSSIVPLITNSENRKYKNLSGAGIVMAGWILCSIFKLEIGYYYVSLTSYLLLNSIYHLNKYKNNIWSTISFVSLYAFIFNVSTIAGIGFNNFLLSASLLSLVFGIISSQSEGFKYLLLNYEVKKSFSALSSFTAISILFLMLFRIFSNPEYISTLTSLIAGSALLISRQGRIGQNLSGLGAVLSVWNLASLTDANFQLYVIPVTLYLLALSYSYNRDGRIITGQNLELLSFLWQFSTLLGQSVFASDGLQVLYGMVLIALCIIVVMISLIRNEKKLLTLALSFIVLELMVRLYVVILSVPWWIYVGLFGLSLIGIAVFILWRVGNKPNHIP